MPSKGLALPILLAQRAAFANAAPQFKLTPAGWLDYLLSQSKPNILNDTIDDKSGYIRDVKIRFKKRIAPGLSSTEDDCSIQAVSPYYEQTIGSTLFRHIAIWFDWNTIEKFTEDALAMQAKGTPATQLMTEVIDSMATALNGLIGDINNDCLGLQSAAFGKNLVSGNNLVRTVNFPLSTTTNPLASGMTQVMSDAMMNEIQLRNASVIGSGLINSVYLQNVAKGIDQSGLDTTKLTMPKFYFDPYAQAAWGANQFAVAEQDAVQFINICRFRGPKTKRWGTSEFGTIQWPIMDSLGGGDGLRKMEFDFQAKEVDCPQTGVIIGSSNAYVYGEGEPYGANSNVIDTGRGLQFDLMCSFATVNIPDTAYNPADRLNGVNGTLRYVATNA